MIMVFIILILLSFSIVLFSFFQKRNEPLEMKKNEIDNIFDNGEYIIAIIEYNRILKKLIENK
jgi:Na+-transporting methylmalonyl-CoA/oxaloacetate decarboxylase gamma subunit